MFGKKTFSLIAVAGLFFLVLFEIRLPLNFAGIESVQAPDPEVEAAFGLCYAEKDEEMHRAVFAAIDNPDVQKEMINTNREKITRDCRQRFPETTITVEREVPMNLVDIKPRFW